MRRFIAPALAILQIAAPQPVTAAEPFADVPVATPGLQDAELHPETRIGAVRVLTDVVYATRPGVRPLRLDLYLPPRPDPRPVVVFVHGGSWTSGSKRSTATFDDFPGVLARFADLGFAMASVEYRLSAEAPFPGAVDDVAAAVRFLRENADRFGIDGSRLVLWGGSAGAHIAAMVAYGCQAEARDADCVDGFVGWYGPYDMVARMNGPPIGSQTLSNRVSPAGVTVHPGALDFFRCDASGCDRTLLEQASPVRLVTPGDPPALLLHGTADRLVPAEQTRLMAERLDAASVPVEVGLIEGVGHGWRGSGRNETADASREALRLTVAFLRRIFEDR
jgi:acetyl esterase/lipase